nr:uncharacterized protein LOC113722186 [Coffea arabica]
MVRWAVELSEYELGYQPRTVIKAQALADFIAEGVSFGTHRTNTDQARETVKAGMAKETGEVAYTRQAVEALRTRETTKATQTPESIEALRAEDAAEVPQANKVVEDEQVEEAARAEQAREAAEVERAEGAVKAKQARGTAQTKKAIEAAGRTNPVWTLYVDGASNKEGCGASLLLISPTGEELAYALRFDFRASNNEFEYETLIAGLEIARKLGIESIKVYSDSQLIVNQV